MKTTSIGLSLVSLSALMLISCASKPPSFQEGPDAEVTFDGLVRIDNTAFKRVWADPDADLSGYTSILPYRADIEFRAVKGKAGRTSGHSSSNEFPIAENDREKIIATISEVMHEEISANQRFAITDEPGPDTLILAVSLLDIVSRVPPERAGRGNIFISTVGEITIVFELKDSQSGETLLRAAERRAVEPAGSRGMVSSSVTNLSELRRLARRWGSQIRNGLDTL
jgi:Protein of unknown function (DUF3313)